MWVLSLDWDDPLEKEKATLSCILAWRIPWTEELGGLQSTDRKESDTTERLHFHFLKLYCTYTSPRDHSAGGVGPEILHFNQFSGDADPAGPWITV